MASSVKKGYCDACPEWSANLVDGLCIQCRKKYQNDEFLTPSKKSTNQPETYKPKLDSTYTPTEGICHE